jgi:hypothetical protein
VLEPRQGGGVDEEDGGVAGLSVAEPEHLPEEIAEEQHDVAVAAVVEVDQEERLAAESEPVYPAHYGPDTGLAGDGYQGLAEPVQHVAQPSSEEVGAYQQFLSERRDDISTQKPSPTSAPQYKAHTKQYYQPGYRKLIDNTIFGSSNKIHQNQFEKTERKSVVAKRHPHQGMGNPAYTQQMFGDWVAQWDRVYKRWFYFNKKTKQSTWTKPIQFKPAHLKPQLWKKDPQPPVRPTKAGKGPGPIRRQDATTTTTTTTTTQPSVAQALKRYKPIGPFTGLYDVLTDIYVRTLL